MSSVFRWPCGWALLVGVLAAAVACITSPAQAGALAVSASNASPDVVLEVLELKRVEGGFVSLKFRIINHSNEPCCANLYAEKAYLLDNANKKKYLVVRDDTRACLCGGGLGAGVNLEAGSTVSLWARFGAPSENVEKLAVGYGDFPPTDSVPLGR